MIIILMNGFELISGLILSLFSIVCVVVGIWCITSYPELRARVDIISAIVFILLGVFLAIMALIGFGILEFDVNLEAEILALSLLRIS